MGQHGGGVAMERGTRESSAHLPSVGMDASSDGYDASKEFRLSGGSGCKTCRQTSCSVARVPTEWDKLGGCDTRWAFMC